MNGLICTVSCSLLLVAWGGGGGESSSTPTNPNQVFNLSKLEGRVQGTVYTANVTGNDSNGNSITGTVSLKVAAARLQGRVMVVPQETVLNLTVGSTSPMSSTTTSYLDATTYDLNSIFTQQSRVTCTSTSPDKLPTTVKVGDSGIRSPLTCDSGTTVASSYKVTSAGNDRINVITSTSINQARNPQTTSNTTLTVDANGNIVGFSAKTVELSAGYTQSYHSLSRAE